MVTWIFRMPNVDNTIRNIVEFWINTLPAFSFRFSNVALISPFLHVLCQLS